MAELSQMKFVKLKILVNTFVTKFMSREAYRHELKILQRKQISHAFEL